MGKRYEQHSDLCGCERCALEYERDHPQPVWDVIEDPDYCSGGCGERNEYCACGDDY